ncbi:hypothetical protein [Flammeovirga sp. SJP92]|uniref:beta strand repeat-containing protein n=1 Tax=Flammeovirga sp. SJP92 TaxID=1775430 RepID=UPI000787435C|nr:hypothetical protein [Flammeovirga sp. SJP92]KXX72105.1 hypothetical protein AVL50_02495 [Flammeovirga sp. SJP92]
MNYSWKNWKGLVIASSFLFAGLIGCNKEYSEQDFLNDQANLAEQNALLQDSLEKARIMDSLKTNGYLIDYTVKVVSGNEASFSSNNARTMDTHSGASAVVTFIQGDSLATITANEQGFAFFANVKPGVATVNVELADHTPVSMNIEFLSPEALSLVGPFSSNDSTYYYNEKDSVWMPTFLEKDKDILQYRHASTIIPVFNTADSLGTSSISGKAVYVSSLVSATRTAIPDGVRISASIDASNEDFTERYLDNYAGDSHMSNGEIDGIDYQDFLSPRILKAVYEGSVSSTTTTGGTYNLRVPTAVKGLPICLKFSDFSADQEIAFNKIKGENMKKPRVESIAATFSSVYLETEPSSSDYVDQDIPDVLGATIEIETPPVAGSGATLTGSVVPRSLTDDEWVTDADRNSGENYDLVVITNAGSGYTGGEGDDAVNIEISGSTTDVDACAYTRIEGTVASVTIKTQSADYFIWDDNTLNDVVDLEITPMNDLNPVEGDQVDLMTSVSFSGMVDGITVTNGGKGYTSVPNVTISGGSGSGATAVATVDGSIAELTSLSGGSGYAFSAGTPTITATPSNGSSFVSNLSGSFSEVTLAGGGSGYTNSRRPTITIDEEYGAGSGAVIDFDIEGPVNNIVQVSAGEGYQFSGDNNDAFDDAATKPTVTFSTGVDSDNATATFGDLEDASVTGFTLTTAITGLTASEDYYIVVSNGGDEIGRFNATADGSGEIAGPFTTNVSTEVATVSSLSITNIEVFEEATDAAAGTITVGDIGTVTMIGGLNLILDETGTYNSEPTITITDTNKTGSEVASYLAYINGSITNVTLSSAGSGYRWGNIADDATDPTNTTYYTISIDVSDPQNYVDYSGGSSTGSVSFDLLGAVNEVIVTNDGSNFDDTPTIDIAHPGTLSGTQATVSAVLGFEVDGITITNVGSGYTAKPTVTIDAPTGTGFTRQAFVEADDITLKGEITAVNIEKNGYYAIESGPTEDHQGYIKITSNSDSDFEAVGMLNGKVTGIYIEDGKGGRDYVDTPTITISGGNGADAAATWSLFGKQYAFAVNAGGSSYFQKPRVLEDKSGAILGVSTSDGTGSSIGGELYNHDGSFEITAGELVMSYVGNMMKTEGYYLAEPTIVVEAKQPVAPKAEVRINSHGEVTGFEVTDEGEGYDKTTVPAITITTVGPAEVETASLAWIPSVFQDMDGDIWDNTFDDGDLIIVGGKGYRENVNEITSNQSFQILGGEPDFDSSNGVTSIMALPGVDIVLDVDYGTGRREVEVE